MTDLIQVMKTASVDDIEKQIKDLVSKKQECASHISILVQVLHAVNLAQFGSAFGAPKPPATSPVQPDDNVNKPPIVLSWAIRPNEINQATTAPQEPTEPPPDDTSEEDTAAQVEAVFAETALQDVKPVVEEIAAPPAEVVTTPKPKPAPEPTITKPRTLSPDARNQKISIGDRAKLYLEFAYNATAMAIGNGIDLPDPTQMAKHLQKDSRFVKDPRGFWKLAGT